MALHHETNTMSAPHTPRRHPMSTPSVDPIPRVNSPPRLGWQLGAALPVDDLLGSSEQLCQALARGSMPDIQRILDTDPDAAWMPVFMDGMQPPLCAAFQSCCYLKMIELLNARGGAQVNMVSCHGQGPLSVLASCRCALGPQGSKGPATWFDVPDFDVWLSPKHSTELDGELEQGPLSFLASCRCALGSQGSEGPPTLVDVPDFDGWLSPEHNTDFDGELEYKEMENWILSVAAPLLQAGCITTDRDSSGKTPMQIALDNGWLKLASLIQEWQGFKTCQMLKCIASRSRQENSLDCFQSLPSSTLCHILEFIGAGNPAELFIPTWHAAVTIPRHIGDNVQIFD